MGEDRQPWDKEKEEELFQAILPKDPNMHYWNHLGRKLAMNFLMKWIPHVSGQNPGLD